MTCGDFSLGVGFAWKADILLKRLLNKWTDSLPLQNEIEFGDDVERPIFEQILDMDEDEDKEFSRSIVLGFLEQAEQTFDKMETEL
jgi:hypothetical protein